MGQIKIDACGKCMWKSVHCGFCWISDKTVTVNIRLVTALIRRKSSQSVASNKNKNAKACAEIEAQIYIDGSISACGLAV